MKSTLACVAFLLLTGHISAVPAANALAALPGTVINLAPHHGSLQARAPSPAQNASSSNSSSDEEEERRKQEIEDTRDKQAAIDRRLEEIEEEVKEGDKEMEEAEEAGDEDAKEEIDERMWELLREQRALLFERQALDQDIVNLGG